MNYVKKLKPFFIDERGEMTKLLDEGKGTNITSAIYMTCKKGSIRANHYHKKDVHYSYLLRGKMEYTSQSFSPKSKKEVIIVKPGEIIYTPVMTIHAMRFLEDSEVITLATEPRDHEGYEKDTVRIDLIEK